MLKEVKLANGLHITFTDKTNRYFGDYHHVCVVATITCVLPDLPLEGPDDEAWRRQAIELIGDRLSVAKRFERMGVPTAAVAEIRSALIDDFLRHASVYLARPEYPRSLVKAELRKRGPQRFYA
jgi:hypothetical protein